MTTTEIALRSARIAHPDRVSQATAVEQARAVAEVAAAVRVAQDNPRDEARAYERMRQTCHTKALAERAFYSLPRAGGRIEGSTVHLMRELARCWGNVDYGIRELHRDDTEGVSEMQAWAWCQEANVRTSRSFIVPHQRMKKVNGQPTREALIDLADVANNNNSVAARAVRETIKHVLPASYVAEAEDIAARTLQDGGGKTIPQQVADAIAHFRDTWNVTSEQLEARLERPSGKWTVQDLAVLRVISGELSRGEKRAETEFPPVERRTTADDIRRQQAPGDVDTATGEVTGPASDPEPITKAQMTKLHATLSELNLTDRDDKLAFCGEFLGRALASSKDLSRDEASALIEHAVELVAARGGSGELFGGAE